MRNHCRIYICALLTAFLTIFIYGCGGSSSSTTTGNTISVTVSPTTATVASGATTQFTATVTNDSSNAGVTWTNVQPGVAEPVPDAGIPFRLPDQADLPGRLDAVLELLDSTADSLAAEWDLRSDAALDAYGNDDGGFGPTIQ